MSLSIHTAVLFGPVLPDIRPPPSLALVPIGQPSNHVLARFEPLGVLLEPDDVATSSCYKQSNHRPESTAVHLLLGIAYIVASQHSTNPSA